tara:strand:- start:79 stop:444 length:366 start_codon:yes stop_codon:yes gene_type:complete
MTGKQPKNSMNGKADHLKRFQWKKGESGNPTGRPKGSVSLETELRKRLSDGEVGDRIVQDLIDEAIRQALAGEYKFFNLIWERMDGKVTDRVSIQAEAPIFDEDDMKRFEKIVEAADIWEE